MAVRYKIPSVYLLQHYNIVQSIQVHSLVFLLRLLPLKQHS